MNRRFITTATFAAILHSLLWSACAGFLKATGFSFFTFESLFGLAPTPRHSALQELAFVVQGLISYPVALLPVWGNSRVLDIMLLIGNSLTWGICITVPIYVLRQKIQKRKAVA